MKYSALYFPIIIITAGLFIGFSCTPGQDHENAVPAHNHVEEKNEIPLIYHMGFMSRYTKKLYFSGVAENWELADIYSHELEEIAEMIAEKYDTGDDIRIGELTGAMMLPQIEQVEEAIDNRDPELFKREFNVLIQTCNQCHAATDYGAVRITIPEYNPFNQDFSRSN